MAWTAPFTFVAAATLTAAKLNEQIRDNWNAAFPVGSLHWRMQSETSVETAVDGFGLECNGVAVSRTTYADLQTKLSGLSYPFGSGNGTTTMNVPDLRGRPAWMCGSNTAADIGDSDGVAEASRTPTQTDTISISGTSGGTAPGVTSTGVDQSFNHVTVLTGVNSHTHSFSDTDVASITVPHLFVGVVIVKY